MVWRENILEKAERVKRESLLTRFSAPHGDIHDFEFYDIENLISALEPFHVGFSSSKCHFWILHPRIDLKRYIGFPENDQKKSDFLNLAVLAVILRPFWPFSDKTSIFRIYGSEIT